jgi:spore coat protein B
MYMNFPQRQTSFRSEGAAARSRSAQTTRSAMQQASNLIGWNVRINRGGPDALDGRLVSIPSNYLVVSTRDGIIYVNAAHVKSITEVSRSASSGGRSSPQFITASSFASLLSRLRHQFVQINRGGPEKIDGFLAEVSPDFLLLVVNREVVRIPVFHIKTINVSGQNKSGNKSGRNNQSRSGSSGGTSGGQRQSSRGRSGSRSKS